MPSVRNSAVLLCLILASVIAGAQQLPPVATHVATPCAPTTTHTDTANMDHAAHLAELRDCAANAVPTLTGQAAFGAITEVVNILKADPNTDWSKVNVEALRAHLIDMDDVILHSTARQRNVVGGLEIEVTGVGRTIAAIRRMTANHAVMLEMGSAYHAAVAEIPGGVRLTVIGRAELPSLVAQIRGLGFAGIMTEGDHHTRHHLAIARGEPVHGR